MKKNAEKSYEAQNVRLQNVIKLVEQVLAALDTRLPLHVMHITVSRHRPIYNFSTCSISTHGCCHKLRA